MLELVFDQSLAGAMRQAKGHRRGTVVSQGVKIYVKTDDSKAETGKSWSEPCEIRTAWNGAVLEGTPDEVAMLSLSLSVGSIAGMVGQCVMKRLGRDTGGKIWIRWSGCGRQQKRGSGFASGRHPGVPMRCAGCIMPATCFGMRIARCSGCVLPGRSGEKTVHGSRSTVWGSSRRRRWEIWLLMRSSCRRSCVGSMETAGWNW